MGRTSGILAVEYTLGEDSLTHEELERRFGVESMKKVLAGAGIRNRRIAPAGVCGSDLAFDAAQKMFSRHALDPKSFDLLIFCTQSPDYLMPTTACLLHERLGLRKECACFDINLGCSQYVYALSVANGLIATGVASRALVLTGDTMSQTVNAMDRSIAPLLGDGGSATMLAAVPDGGGFLGFELGTDGSGAEYLMLRAGGFRMPVSPETAIAAADAEGNVRSPQNFYMNGAAVFHFAISMVPKMVQGVLAKTGLSMDGVDLFLFHQANKYMLDYLVKKMKIPPEKTHFFLEEVGNTSGSTMPILLAEAWRAGKIRPGSVVLMAVFGVGFSWAATVVRWPEETMGA